MRSSRSVKFFGITITIKILDIFSSIFFKTWFYKTWDFESILMSEEKLFYKKKVYLILFSLFIYSFGWLENIWFCALNWFAWDVVVQELGSYEKVVQNLIYSWLSPEVFQSN